MSQMWALEDKNSLKKAEIQDLKVKLEETENRSSHDMESLKSQIAHENAVSDALIREQITEIETLKAILKPDFVVYPEVTCDPGPAPPLIEPQLPPKPKFGPPTFPPKSALNQPEVPLMGNPQFVQKPAVSSEDKCGLSASPVPTPPLSPKLEGDESKNKSAVWPGSNPKPTVPEESKAEPLVASTKDYFTRVLCCKCKHYFKVPIDEFKTLSAQYCANCRGKGKDCALF